MKTIKLILSMLVCFSMLPGSPRLYAQGGAVPAAIVKESVTIVEEKVPYVKPGYVTVNFKDADILAVFNYLSEVSGVDIVPSPDVTGNVTLRLTDKPWEVALDIIVKNYGYAFEREGDIIRVVTLSSLKLEELSTEVISLNYATAEDARSAITDMLTERGKITYDSRVNALVVTDLATNLYKIKQVINTLDKKTPQIMIEAKIIETVLGKDERLGIDWNLVIGLRGAARPTTIPFHAFWPDWGLQSDLLANMFPVGETAGPTSTYDIGGQLAITDPADFPTGATAVDFATRAFPYVPNSMFTYGTLDFTQFSAILEYLKARSGTDIISSPRITTLNNKQAKMFVGKVYNYISEIEQKESTGGQERWTYEIEKEEIGIRLLVTPHINENGDIKIELKPEIKDVIGFQQVTEFFALPIFTTREAETQVMVRDSETIFIGGLIKENNKEYEKKFPLLGDLLGDLPFIGGAVKYKAEKKEKIELVIFLTVHVVKDLKTLARYGTRDITNIETAKVVYGDKEALEITDEVFVELPAGKSISPKPKKEHKPLFDFRKKKKKK